MQTGIFFLMSVRKLMLYRFSMNFMISDFNNHCKFIACCYSADPRITVTLNTSVRITEQENIVTNIKADQGGKFETGAFSK